MFTGIQWFRIFSLIIYDICLILTCFAQHVNNDNKTGDPGIQFFKKYIDNISV